MSKIFWSGRSSQVLVRNYSVRCSKFLSHFFVRPRSYFLVKTYLVQFTVRISGPVRFMVWSLKSVSKLCWYGPFRSRFFFQKRYFRIEPVIDYSPTELICIWSGSYFLKLDFRTKIVTGRFNWSEIGPKILINLRKQKFDRCKDSFWLVDLNTVN